jgi:TusA-related sulfurtransferase
VLAKFFFDGPRAYMQPRWNDFRSQLLRLFSRRMAFALLLSAASRSRAERMHTFDFRNTIVPFSLLDLRQHFKEMRPGDSLEVLWSDSTAADDLLRVLPAACIEIVSTGEVLDPSGGGIRMELIKTRMDPPSFYRR